MGFVVLFSLCGACSVFFTGVCSGVCSGFSHCAGLVVGFVVFFFSLCGVCGGFFSPHCAGFVVVFLT